MLAVEELIRSKDNFRGNVSIKSTRNVSTSILAKNLS